MTFRPSVAIRASTQGAGPVADADHGDDGGNADDDAQRREHGAHRVPAQGAQGESGWRRAILIKAVEDLPPFSASSSFAISSSAASGAQPG